MEIILKETIDTLGQEGEIVKVKPGYARNFLIPKKKAMLVSKAALAQLEREKQAIAARLAAQKKSAAGLAAQLKDKVVIISKRAGDEERLFGSVTNSDIASALAEQGVTVDRRAIVLIEAIKTLGEYKIQIKIGYQATAHILLQVVAQSAGEA